MSQLLSHSAIAYWAADHEAAHAAAAWYFGWHVDEIVIREDGGDCLFVPPQGVKGIVREQQKAIILLAPSFYAGYEGGLSDRFAVWEYAREVCDTDEEREWLQKRLEYEAIQLVADSRFRSAAERVAAALLEKEGKLDANDLAALAE
jgi:hypothetical protein